MLYPADGFCFAISVYIKQNENEEGSKKVQAVAR